MDISSGQRYELKEDLNDNLRAGVFIVSQHSIDHVFLKREDGRNDLAPGQLGMWEPSVLNSMTLLEDTKLDKIVKNLKNKEIVSSIIVVEADEEGTYFLGKLKEKGLRAMVVTYRD